MTIRASDLAAFDYCERAWHYAREGVPAEWAGQAERGSAFHAALERRARRAGALIAAGALSTLIGAALLWLLPALQ